MRDVERLQSETVLNLLDPLSSRWMDGRSATSVGEVMAGCLRSGTDLTWQNLRGRLTANPRQLTAQPITFRQNLTQSLLQF